MNFTARARLRGRTRFLPVETRTKIAKAVANIARRGVSFVFAFHSLVCVQEEMRCVYFRFLSSRIVAEAKISMRVDELFGAYNSAGVPGE